MSSQRSASGPSAVRARSARWARWVASRQKSSAGPVTRWVASSGPYVHRSPPGPVSSTRNGSAGGVSPWAAWAKSRARTPMRATCRSRPVGGRVTPRAAAMSRPWAQVSIRRAVAMEAVAMGGPYQGKRAPGAAVRSASARAARPSRQAVSSAAGSCFAPSSAPSSTYRSGAASACSTSALNPSSSVTAARAARSVQFRCAIWWAIVQPGAGVARRQPSGLNSATRASSSSLSSRRSSITGVGSDTVAPLGTAACGAVW